MSRLSFSTRKSLCVQLGETAGKELADVLQQLIDRIEYLERSKVDVTPIIRVTSNHDSASSAGRRAA